GDTVEDSELVALGVAVPATRAGAIEVPGDVDFYQVVAPENGVLTVRQTAAGDGPLDSFLTAFDESGNRLAENDDAGAGTADGVVRFPVKQGDIYFLRAGTAAARGVRPDRHP